MKKLLILTRYYPPLPDVAGRRYAGFAQHLPDYGWTASILAVGPAPVPLTNPTVTWQPLPGATSMVSSRNTWRSAAYRLARGLAAPWLIPDGLARWTSGALRQLVDAYVQEHQPDAILVSCGPFSLPLAALFGTHRVPVILDFRDGLTLNPYSIYPAVLDPLFRRYERQILGAARGFITTTPLTTRAYQERYPDLAERMETVMNGFDEEGFGALPSPIHSSTFTVVYAGVVDEHRSIAPVIEAFLALQLPQAELVIAGRVDDPRTRQLMTDQANIHFRGHIPHAESLQLLAGADLAIINQGFDIRTPVCYPIAAKTYEYLRLGVPILCYAPEGDNAQLIRRFSPQSFVVTEPSLEALKHSLLTAYERRQQGDLSRWVDPTYLQQFRRSALTKQLAHHLDTWTA